MIVWVPCVLVGAWASGVLPPAFRRRQCFPQCLSFWWGSGPYRTSDGWCSGGHHVFPDSQFLCLGTIFTNDIVLHRVGPKKYSDKQVITIARLFIIAIVAITYGLAMVAKDANVFDLAIWCFSGFSALFPVVFAALYWKRATKQGVIAKHSGRSRQLGLLLPPFWVWRRILRGSGHSSRGYLFPCGKRGARRRISHDRTTFKGNPQEVFP